MKKVKIFLGGYVNCTNAQNLNCLALAKHLDKSKYEVFTMCIPKGDFIPHNINGVHYIKGYWPFRIYRYFIYCIGIIRCNIAYLPKRELMGFTLFLLKLFNRRSFATVEGVIIGTNYEKALVLYGNINGIRKAYSFCDAEYSISQYIKKTNNERLGIQTRGVLYLGVDIQLWKLNRAISRLTDIVFIGSNMKYKGIEDYFAIAEIFPQLTFHIVGSGLGLYDPKVETDRRQLKNIVVHGSLSHEQLSQLLQGIQLMFFPSRSEGFPKVILECAAAGVPSIVYGDYGADEWITQGRDGFVVDSVQEASVIIQDLIENPDQMIQLSQNAVKMAECFDWNVVIKDWEKEIGLLIRK